MSVKSWAESYGSEMFFLSLILLAIAVLVFPGCGTESRSKEPSPPPGPVIEDKEWEAVKGIVKDKCAICHNGSVHPLTFNSGAKFKASKAKERIANGSMPPGGGLDPASKQKLLAYLGG